MRLQIPTMAKLLYAGEVALISGLLLFPGCNNEEIPAPGSGEEGQEEENSSILPIKLSENEFTSENTYYLLNDDESEEVYFDSGQRSFYVNKPLQISFQEDNHFQLRFYSPRAISNVTVWAKMKGYDEDFKFMELEKVMPFQQLRVPIPFASKDMEATTRSGQPIVIAADSILADDSLSFAVECNDPYYTKLMSNRCNWRIYFSSYGYSGYWKYKLLPAHAREAVAMALNMSYMFSIDKFTEALNAFGPLHSDNNKTEIDKNALREKILSHKGLIFGHTSGVGGLGGGQVFGLAEYCFLEHYADDKDETTNMFHEYGHCLGYGHNGNMSYEVTGPGWVTLCGDLYTTMSKEKELPIYSRRFMHTRKNTNRYDKTNLYLASRHVIEDPELDALDGGLSPMTDETDTGGNDGAPLSITVNYQNIPNASATTFTPKDVYVYGDEMYVANGAANNFSIEIFNLANGSVTHTHSIKEWTVDGETRHFTHAPNGVTRSNGKLYVTHAGNRVEIFDADTREYVTCIGDGTFGESNTRIAKAFDVTVYRGLVFVRDSRYVNVIEESWVQPNQTMYIYARSNNRGQADGIYGMAIEDTNHRLYSAHQASKRVDVFDLYLLSEGQMLEYRYDFSYKNNPYALDFHDDRLFVSSNGNEKLCEVSIRDGEIIKDYTSVGGITLKTPEKFCIRRNTLFVVDTNESANCVYAIPMSEFN